jgi:hypothetical protein
MTHTKEEKSEYNKKYRQKMTEEQKEAKRLADREYYYKNKEKCNERNLRYYENHKEQIKENGAKNNKKRRQNLREQAKQKLGGKCVWCETTENLEFDHIDPAQKSLSENLIALLNYGGKKLKSAVFFVKPVTKNIVMLKWQQNIVIG